MIGPCPRSTARLGRCRPGRCAADRGSRRRRASTRRTAGSPARPLSPTRSGLTACQTSTYGCPSTSTNSPPGPRATCSAIRRLLAPRHQVVDQHTEPPAAFRGEFGDDPGEIVHAAEVLDHYADVAQVIAPDLLDQFGVVPALDVDPAGQRDLRPLGRCGDRAGGGPRRTSRGIAAPGRSASPACPRGGSRVRAGSSAAADGGPPGPPDRSPSGSPHRRSRWSGPRRPVRARSPDRCW